MDKALLTTRVTHWKASSIENTTDVTRLTCLILSDIQSLVVMAFSPRKTITPFAVLTVYMCYEFSSNWLDGILLHCTSHSFWCIMDIICSSMDDFSVHSHFLDQRFYPFDCVDSRNTGIWGRLTSLKIWNYNEKSSWYIINYSWNVNEILI